MDKLTDILISTISQMPTVAVLLMVWYWQIQAHQRATQWYREFVTMLVKDLIQDTGNEQQNTEGKKSGDT